MLYTQVYGNSLPLPQLTGGVLMAERLGCLAAAPAWELKLYCGFRPKVTRANPATIIQTEE